MFDLTTLVAILRPFAVAARDAASRGERFGGDPTGYGPGVRAIASSPFLDGWRGVNDPHWPVNWNAHLVLPGGAILPAPTAGVRHDLTV